MKVIQCMREHYRLIIIPIALLVMWGIVYNFFIPRIETTTPELTSLGITFGFIVSVVSIMYILDKIID